MADRAPDHLQQTQRVDARLAELAHRPVSGQFDLAHLCEIHRRVFQDLPDHHPGQLRLASGPLGKTRTLAGVAHRYFVPYAPQTKVSTGLHQVLGALGGPETLRPLAADAFCERIAGLYADLDYLHPFAVGTSQTLRVFSSQLAAEAGVTLHWGTQRVTPHTRDALHIARDVAVLQRAYPGLDAQRAERTSDRAERDAYHQVLAPFAGAPTLAQLIASTAYAPAHLAVAQRFRGEAGPFTAQEPALQAAEQALAFVMARAQADRLDPQQQQTVRARTREALAVQLERGYGTGAAVMDTQAEHDLER